MFGRIGPSELILILVIALVVFGPSKLPEVGQALGKGMREFRNSMKDIQKDIQTAVEDDPKQNEHSGEDK